MNILLLLPSILSKNLPLSFPLAYRVMYAIYPYEVLYGMRSKIKCGNNLSRVGDRTFLFMDSKISKGTIAEWHQLDNKFRVEWDDPKKEDSWHSDRYLGLITPEPIEITKQMKGVDRKKAIVTNILLRLAYYSPDGVTPETTLEKLIYHGWLPRSAVVADLTAFMSDIS